MDIFFQGYLESVAAGSAHDATALMSAYTGPHAPLLIDQGTSDGFLSEQLKPEAFVAGE